MVEHLSAAKAMTGAMRGLLLAAFALVLPSGAYAEEIPDPMRPPLSFGQAQFDETPAGPVLQSVLISATRRIAIVSGKTVKVGDKVGDAQVLAINENEVILKSGKNRQVLKLFPTLRDLAPAKPERSRDIPGQPK